MLLISKLRLNPKANRANRGVLSWGAKTSNREQFNEEEGDRENLVLGKMR